MFRYLIFNNDLQCGVKDKNFCKNGGKCYFVIYSLKKKTFEPNIKYCECSDKYYGQKCDRLIEEKEDKRLWYVTEDDIMMSINLY